MKKILIIGSNSYIGKKLHDYVNEHYNDRYSIDTVSGSNGVWKDINFTIYDIVLHLSAIVHRKETDKMKELYYKINHLMAVEIAQKAKLGGVKQFIFMSTAAVYGSNVTRISKDTKPNPTTYYGKSKFAAENDIIKLESDYFKVAILRPPMVYGDGCKGNYPRLVKLAKYTFIFPKLHNKRSMIYIITLIQYILNIMDNESGGYYHPQDEKYVDTCELIIKLRKELGKETYLVSWFNAIIQYLSNYIPSMNKIFTDYYYDNDLDMI